MNTAINIVGIWVMMGSGILMATLFLAGCSLLLGMVGRKVYLRLLRIYHLETIHYYLNRLEKEGTHCFKKEIK